MKTLKSLLAGVALLFVCVAVNAKPANIKNTKDDVVKHISTMLLTARSAT